MDAMRAGSIDVPGIISQHVDLDDVVDGFSKWSEPGSELLKTIIRVS